jgi:hypothetical protein
MMRWTASALTVGLLFAAGCESSAKKEQDVASSAQAEAQKRADEAAETARKNAVALQKDVNEKRFAEKKAAVTKSIAEEGEAMDRKIAFLKEKAARLPSGAKKRADDSWDALDKARSNVTTEAKAIESATEDGLDVAVEKSKAAVTSAKASLAVYETAVVGKVK